MQILALHGFTGRGSDFSRLARSIGGDWCCPDLPGHGPSPVLDCSPENSLQFLDTQKFDIDSQKRILFGYSMGGRAALLHATQQPDSYDALILVSPNPGIEDAAARAARRDADDTLAQSIEDNGVAAFLNTWQETPLIRAQKNLPEDIVAEMQSARMEHTTNGLANSLRQFGQGSVPNLWPVLHTLKMPVCVVTGDRDAKYSKIAERMQKEIGANCHHIKMPGVSHAPHFEASEVFSGYVGRFLSEI